MRILVTGGSGFLGSCIIKQLLKKGYHVRAIQRTYPHVLKELQSSVEIVLADLTEAPALKNATKNIDAIIHVAAKAGIWGNFQDFYQANVIATKNLIQAAREQDVSCFVYTSTPSVVSTPLDIEYADESLPYSNKFLCHYAQTKALAEQEVINAHTPSFKTIALRPHLIWGEGDPHLVPTLLKKAKSLKIIGKGDNQVDFTHVENAAHAHLLALESLLANKNNGQIYFVSDDKPVYLWPWINNILDRLGYPIINKKISFKAAYYLGYLFEKLYSNEKLPPLTRFMAIQLGKSHYFNIQKIKSELGYQPIVDPQWATEKYIQHIIK